MAHSSRSAPPLLVRTVRSTHRLEEGTEYHIGRDERAAIPVTDPRVSWDHAVLYVSDGTWVLEDQGSRNVACPIETMSSSVSSAWFTRWPLT